MTYYDLWQNFLVLKTVLQLLAVVSLFGLTSCFPKDKAIVLPPVDTAVQTNMVNLGDDYSNATYFDFGTNSIVHSSPNNHWHISLSASPTEHFIVLNGGIDVLASKLTMVSFANVTDADIAKAPAFMFDNPSLNKDSLACGYLSQSENNQLVYLFKLQGGTYYKMAIQSITKDYYDVVLGPINEPVGQSIRITKDEHYNFKYVNLENQAEVLNVEPTNQSFDLVFTRYKHIYYNLDNTPYLVNGAMLNPHGTYATMIDGKPFAEVTLEDLNDHPLTNAWNTIGFDWKVYDFDNGLYKVRPNRTYIVRNEAGEIWKLRFVNFYNSNGDKGFPTFEFQQLQ